MPKAKIFDLFGDSYKEAPDKKPDKQTGESSSNNDEQAEEPSSTGGTQSDALQSSKEIFQLLNPYLEKIMKSATVAIR